MKKLILAICAAILLCGCEPNIQTECTYCEDGAKIYTRKFEFEGHSYIEFRRSLPGDDNYTGFVHDPNCPCMIDYD